MDTEDLSAPDAQLAVNEQVIVMSGQETIRVLEVEVDAALTPSSSSSSGVEPRAEEGGAQSTKEAVIGCTTTTTTTADVTASTPNPVPSTPTVSTAPAPAQPGLPISLQSCPQVISQEGLASLMSGMLTQQGSLAQPLLIPLNVAGPVGGAGGLAVLTLPTLPTVATLPGLNTGTSGVKLPFTGLQATTVLNQVQTQLQSPMQSVQPATQKLPDGLQSVGLSINPAIIQSLAQPQFISSLTAAPIITSTVSSVGQIITNQQGQVIGTLPLLLNPAASALPAQGLQVQTMSPQLLLNPQGQIIAAIGNTPPAAPPTAAVLPKTTIPLTLNKTNVQGVVSKVTSSKVIIAPQPSAVKTVGPLGSSLTDVPTVGLVVTKPQAGGNEDETINLAEIREFAKNFKIRRLSLGLTQTQVGQALTATEGPAYSQSAICRFEKLDITPKSAQKLKPVLERWLAEAELWNQKGQQNLMEFVGGEPSKKRKRRTSFTPQAIEVLNSYFEKNSLPTGQEITEIAKELNYDREVVRVWFCNRRQTLKNTSKFNVFQSQ